MITADPKPLPWWVYFLPAVVWSVMFAIPATLLVVALHS